MTKACGNCGRMLFPGEWCRCINATTPASSPTPNPTLEKDVVEGGSCAAASEAVVMTRADVVIDKLLYWQTEVVRLSDSCDPKLTTAVNVRDALMAGLKGYIGALENLTPQPSEITEGNHADTTPGTSDVEAPQIPAVPQNESSEHPQG